jgi:hypothetical protein
MSRFIVNTLVREYKKVFTPKLPLHSKIFKKSFENLLKFHHFLRFQTTTFGS